MTPGGFAVICYMILRTPDTVAARRNPPYPTLILWADSVYPDHLRMMYHIFIDVCLSREIWNIPPKTAWRAVGILRITQISRISRKIGIRRDPQILHRGGFWFSVTDSRILKYLRVSAKLAARRNHPNPTLVVWADSVYPDHLCRMRHICIAGCLSREIRNVPKTACGDVEVLRISRISRISRKIGFRRAPNILPRGDFGFFGCGLPYL